MANSIRSATHSEISQLIDIWQSIDMASTMDRPFGGDHPNKAEHTRTLLQHTLTSDNAAVLVAVNAKNTIIGTISGHVFEKPAVNLKCVGVIYSLWVNETHRQQGIAQSLLTRLETELTNKGARAFQVGWDVGNSHAASWWQKRGYLSYEVIASKIVDAD